MVGCSVDDGWTVLMCIESRISHFTRYPELVPRALHSQLLDAHTAGTRYHLENAHLGITHNSNRRLSEAYVLCTARLTHGGDIGIKAFANDAQDQVSKTRARVHDYSLR